MADSRFLCLLKICASAGALLGVAVSEKPLSEIGKAFEALVKGRDAFTGLIGADGEVFQSALRNAEKKLREAYDEALAKTHSDDSFRENVEGAFANLELVFEKCVPTGQQFAKLKLDPQKIGESIADAAVRESIDFFRAGEGRKLLIVLVALAFQELDRNPKFMEALARANWMELFEQLDGLSAKLDRQDADRKNEHNETSERLGRMEADIRRIAKAKNVPERPLRRPQEARRKTRSPRRNPRPPLRRRRRTAAAARRSRAAAQ